MKPTFLNYDRPLLTLLINEADTPEKFIEEIELGNRDGAEAFGLQLEVLKREYRTEAILREIFSHCQGKPIYITSYRGGDSKGLTDDECVEFLLLGQKAGATIMDIMGDLYNPVRCQMTFDEQAVEKQKALAKRIHDNGGEVLFSAHLQDFYGEEDIMRFAYAQKERGADVVKLVSMSNNDQELAENIKIMARLKLELNKDFLFLAGGSHARFLRKAGGNLGSCMYLCHTDYEKNYGKVQPILPKQKLLRDELYKDSN